MTRSEIIELMARRMYDDEYRAMDELVSAMDRAAGKKCHVHSLGEWESVNKLYEERAKSAVKWAEGAAFAIVPIEPSAKMKMAAAADWDDYDYEVDSMIVAIKGAADCYRAMIAAAIKEQEGRD